MKKFFEPYTRTFTEEEVKKDLEKIKQKIQEPFSTDELKLIYSLIDLTSLNSTDTQKRIQNLTEKVNEFNSKFSDIPQVSAICVYPNFVEVVKNTLKVEGINIASVAGAFPSGQTFINIKTAEIREAIYHGANEVDIVFNIGEFLNEDYAHVFHELKKMRKNAENVHVKVILETGVLQDLDKIYKASILAMEAGADFIKTSTGKEKIGATPEAVYVMAYAIKDFYCKKERKVGLKPAGGISTPETAMFYIQIVKSILGEEWINSNLFRIGASRLANNILKQLTGVEGYF